MGMTRAQKIKYKKQDNRNILDKVIDGKLRAAKKDLDICDLKSETINKALEILKDYNIEEVIMKKLDSGLENLFEESLKSSGFNIKV